MSKSKKENTPLAVLTAGVFSLAVGCLIGGGTIYNLQLAAWAGWGNDPNDVVYGVKLTRTRDSYDTWAQRIKEHEEKPPVVNTCLDVTECNVLEGPELCRCLVSKMDRSHQEKVRKPNRPERPSHRAAPETGDEQLDKCERYTGMRRSMCRGYYFKEGIDYPLRDNY